ncbi:MAG: hypothetical protein BIFFINMI_01931 [Phycisphaerae bacterium]|nr:hypothetical protein [Phycisphaerae bacterium]
MDRRQTVLTALLVMATGLSARPAAAAVQLLSSPPPNVNVGVLQSDTLVYLFAEKQITVGDTDAITVDALVPASLPVTYDTLHPGTNALLAAGTKVRSYFVHMDAAANSGAIVITGSFTFPGDVVALIFEDSGTASSGPGLVDVSDSIFGLAGVTYPTHPGVQIAYRGAVEGETADIITVAADGRTVNFTLRAVDTGIDQMRVLVAVPEPGTLLLLGVAAAGAALRRRRTR